MTARPRSRGAAIAGAVAGAIIGPIALLVAVVIIGQLLPFDEATGSAAFALLFYLLPAACIMGAIVGWARVGPAPDDPSDAQIVAQLPPSRGRTVAAGFLGAVAGMIAIDVIAAIWRAATGGVGDGRVYLVLVLCGTPAALILGAIAGGRAVERGTGAAPK